MLDFDFERMLFKITARQAHQRRYNPHPGEHPEVQFVSLVASTSPATIRTNVSRCSFS